MSSIRSIRVSSSSTASVTGRSGNGGGSCGGGGKTPLVPFPLSKSPSFFSSAIISACFAFSAASWCFCWSRSSCWCFASSALLLIISSSFAQHPLHGHTLTKKAMKSSKHPTTSPITAIPAVIVISPWMLTSLRVIAATSVEAHSKSAEGGIHLLSSFVISPFSLMYCTAWLNPMCFAGTCSARGKISAYPNGLNTSPVVTSDPVTEVHLLSVCRQLRSASRCGHSHSSLS
mmetsp:Transcript_3247/g.7710  ORF Transcript_3247/g.7710 Transcript_3247/m.7710 type:complete len:231 (-) Transcript_3247:1523-2215(-)